MGSYCILYHVEVMMVGAVGCPSCACCMCPVQARQRVRAELEVPQVEERRGGVSTTVPGTWAKARAGSGTGSG